MRNGGKDLFQFEDGIEHSGRTDFSGVSGMRDGENSVWLEGRAGPGDAVKT